MLLVAEVFFHLDLETGLEDLLGELAQQPAGANQVDAFVAGLGTGAGASRLVSGNLDIHRDLERAAADYIEAEMRKLGLTLETQAFEHELAAGLHVGDTPEVERLAELDVTVLTGEVDVLDASAFVPTNRLDLARWKPDFVSLSFYKMFGYPTGIGALIARRDALAKLRRQ